MKNEINVDNLSLEEIKKYIEEFQKSIAQIDASTEIEEKNKTLESSSKLKALRNLKRDTLNVINYYKSALKFKEEEINFNKEPITIKNIGKCASIYYEEDKNWYNGIVNSIDTDNKICNITYFGYNETINVPFKYVKMNKILKIDDLKHGFLCEAIYKTDGFWYNATIERTSELGIHIIFEKYNSEEIVPIDFIRITPVQNMENIKMVEEEKNRINNLKKNIENNKIDDNNPPPQPIKSTFNIPKELKINPSDNDEVKFLKRKRVKQLKNKNKQKEIQKVTLEQQQNWLNFNKNLKKNNKTLNGFSALKTLPK